MKLQIDFEYELQGNIIKTRLEYEDPLYDVLIGKYYVRFIRKDDGFIIDTHTEIDIPSSWQKAIISRLNEVYLPNKG